MKHNIYSILSLSLFLAGFSFTASADEKMEMAKRSTYDYEAGRGEITLESYVGGGAQTSGGSATSSDLDVVLVLDYSGTMGESYSTKSGESKTYEAYVPTTYTYSSFTALSEKPKYTFKGNQYDIKLYHIDNAGTSGNYGNWAYIDCNDGYRYYLDILGTCIQAANKTAPTKTSFPKDVNGNDIKPADGGSAALFAIINKTDYTIEKRVDALRAGVTAFINLVLDDEKTNGTTHRIALVEFRNEKWITFGEGDAARNGYTNSSSPYYLRELYGRPFNENSDKDCTGVLKHFTTLDSENNLIALKSILHYYKPNGNTAIDYGVHLAKLLIGSYARASANKAVIVFTDGNPTRGSSDSYEGAGTDAVKYAKELKYDSSTKKYKYPVYTVYCANKALSSSDKQYKLMNALSSNYPQADAYDDLVESEKNPKQQYYKDSYTKGLITVFKEIGTEILAEIKSKYGAASKLVDYIASSFKLPSNIVKSDVKVYTRKCTDYNSTSKVYSWNTTDSTDITSSVTVTIDATSSPQSVSVMGYDYSKNWCGTLDGTGHGSKVMVKIPFELKDKTAYGNLPTNTDQSGVYVKENDSYKKDEVYNVPKIPFCTLKITRTDLEPGESAIYIITDKDGKFVDQIVLSGTTGATKVERRVYGVPGDSFTVTETNWNWAYNKGTNPQTRSLPASPTSYELVYDFTGKHKDPTGTKEQQEKDPTNRYNHDESVQPNRMSLPYLYL